MKFIVEIEDFEEGEVGLEGKLANKIERSVDKILDETSSDGTVIVTKED